MAFHEIKTPYRSPVGSSAISYAAVPFANPAFSTSAAFSFRTKRPPRILTVSTMDFAIFPFASREGADR